jgi:hypothetical protein
VPDDVLTEIIDEVFLPLVHGRDPERQACRRHEADSPGSQAKGDLSATTDGNRNGTGRPRSAGRGFNGDPPRIVGSENGAA